MAHGAQKKKKKKKKKMNGTVYRILSRTKCIINGTVYHCPGHSAGLIEIIISQITHCRIVSSMCSHLAKDWTQLSGLPLTGFKLSIFFKKYHMYSIYHINIKGVYSRIRNIKSKNTFGGSINFVIWSGSDFTERPHPKKGIFSFKLPNFRSLVWKKFNLSFFVCENVGCFLFYKTYTVQVQIQ